MNNKTVVFDFDGVIHKYSDGWQGIDNIYDEPVEGMKELIEKLRQEHYEVVVVSTRNAEEIGKKAIEKWLEKYNIKIDKVCTYKPPAICYVDDRAISFNGSTKWLYEKIVSFENWIEKEDKYLKMNDAEILGNLMLKQKEFQNLVGKTDILDSVKSLEIYDRWIEVLKEYL